MVFVACTVWHVIPTPEAILKCQIVVVLGGGGGGEGDADCHCNVRCDSVQSPSLPPNLQVIQHDSTGRLSMRLSYIGNQQSRSVYHRAYN